MFLKKLYHYNKIFFVLFFAFILSFVYINYKWGLIATPVMHYGMYSSVFKIKDTQTVYFIEANGNLINQGNISLTDRDVLQIFPEMYTIEKSNNEAVYTTMKKYINLTGLSCYMNIQKYSNQVSDQLFAAWYKSKAEQVIGKTIFTLQVYKQNFVWDGVKLKPASAPIKLPSLGT